MTKPSKDMYELSYCHSEGNCTEIDHYSPAKPQCQDLRKVKSSILKTTLIVPESQRHCKIGNRVLRKCREPVTHIASVNWILYNRKVYFVDELNLIHGLNPKLLDSYHCEGNCFNKNCSKYGCFGDMMFCKHFHCLEKSTCVCTLIENMRLARWILHNGDLYPTCWGTIRVQVESESEMQWSKLTNNLKTKYEQNPIRCNEFSGCMNGAITLNTKDKRIKAIYLKVNEFRQTIDANQTGLEFQFVIPSSFLMRLSNATFQIMGLNGLLKTCVIQCPPVDECAPGSDGVVNSHYEQTVYCWPFYKTVLIAMSSILLIILQIVLIILMIDISINLIFSTKKTSTIISGIRNGFRKLDEIAEDVALEMASKSPRVSLDSNESIDSYILPQPTAPLSSRSPSLSIKSVPFNKLIEQSLKSRGMTTQDILHASLGVLTIVCVSLILSVPQTNACSDTHIIVSDRESCEIVSQTTKACQFYSTSRIQIPSMDQEICLNLQHNDESYGFLKIKSEEVFLTCQKEVAYWTSDVNVNCINEQFCPSFSSFCSFSGCTEEIEKYIRSDRFGNTITIGQCENMSPDLFVQGCPLAVLDKLLSPKACFITVAALDPKPHTVTPAITCNSWMVSVNLDLTLNLNGTSYSQNVTLSQQNSLIQDKIKMELISKNVPQWVTLPDCYISYKGDTYGTTCNPRGTFSLDKIGSIQCPTLADAESFSKNCKYNSDIVSFLNQNCLIKTPSFENMASTKKLPQIRPEFYLFDKGNLSISARLSSEFSIEAQLILEGLTVNVDYVRPKCVFHNLKFDGCYNCASGILANMNLVVNQRGVVNILCPEVPITIPIAVSREKANYDFRFRYSKKEVNLICQLVCSNIIQFEMKGTLRDGDIIIDDPTGKTHHGVTPKTRSIFGGIWFAIKTLLDSLGLLSLFNWFEYIFSGIVLVFLFVLLFCILRFICKAKKAKKDIFSSSTNLMDQISKLFREKDKELEQKLKRKDKELEAVAKKLKKNMKKKYETKNAIAVNKVKRMRKKHNAKKMKIDKNNKNKRTVKFSDD